jgi:hypothetical protein
MASLPQREPQRPTLDDLLRFKRSERPPAEFWQEFEKGLRKKQLAALMNKPRGWARIRPVWVRSMRWSAPVAAAVAVAFLFIQNPSAQLAPIVAATPVPIASASPSREAALVIPSVMESLPAPVAVAQVQHAPAMVQPSAPVPVSAHPVVAAAQQPVAAEETLLAVNAGLSWSEASLGPREARPLLLRTAMHVSQPARENRRRVSSWSPSEADEALAPKWEETDPRLFQVTASDLRVNRAYAGNLPSARARATNARWTQAEDDREYRELASRFSGSSSSLSIRF